MTTGTGVDNRSQGNEHHITRIGGVIAEHGHERHHRCEVSRRRATHGRLDRGGEQSRTLGHPGAKHYHQDIAQGVEVGEGLGHLNPQALDILRGKAD